MRKGPYAVIIAAALLLLALAIRFSEFRRAKWAEAAADGAPRREYMDVRLGMSRKELVSMRGTPAFDMGAALTYRYDGHELTVTFSSKEPDKVASVACAGSSCLPRDGVRTGSTVSQLRRSLGAPSKIRAQATREFHMYHERDLAFGVVKGKVDGIMVLDLSGARALDRVMAGQPDMSKMTDEEVRRHLNIR